MWRVSKLSIVDAPKSLVNGITSMPAPVLSGIPEASVVGPILFIAYINFFSREFTQMQKYSLKSHDEALIVQGDLNSPEDWSMN